MMIKELIIKRWYSKGHIYKQSTLTSLVEFLYPLLLICCPGTEVFCFHDNYYEGVAIMKVWLLLDLPLFVV